MKQLLVIDQDRAAVQKVGLARVAERVGVALADNVSEGVRLLLDRPVSLIVVDATLLRLGAREHAALFDHVAPGVPVVVAVGPTTRHEFRVALELAGFRVLERPVDVDALLGATA